MSDYEFDKFLVENSLNESGVDKTIITEIIDNDEKHLCYQVETVFNDGERRFIHCSGNVLADMIKDE